jgi:hypothetical protein
MSVSPIWVPLAPTFTAVNGPPPLSLSNVDDFVFPSIRKRRVRDQPLELLRLFPLIEAGVADDYIELLERTSLETHLLTLFPQVVEAIVSAIKDDQECIKYLNATFKHFANDDDVVVDAMGELMQTIGVQQSTLRKIKDLFPEIFPVEIVESEIRKGRIIGINFVVDRLSMLYGYDVMGKQEIDYFNDIFGKPTVDAVGVGVAGGVTAAAEDTSEEALISRWLKNFTQKRTKADVPDWIDVKPKETIELLDYDRWSTIDTGPPREEIKNIEDYHNDLQKFEIKGLSSEGLDDLLSSIITSIEVVPPDVYPINPIRMFGPVNRRTIECISAVISGGCRMLTCRCIVEYDDDEDEDTDVSPDGWFTGNCDRCTKIIRDLSHALRFPLATGGWVGCYCSEDCIRKQPPRITTALTDLLLTQSMEAMVTVGILDRFRLTHPVEEKHSKSKPLYLVSKSTQEIIPGLFVVPSSAPLKLP